MSADQVIEIPAWEYELLLAQAATPAVSAEAEKRGAVKALRQVGEHWRAAYGDVLGPEDAVCDWADARADRIESGEVTL